jgi:hypothetical protein
MKNNTPADFNEEVQRNIRIRQSINAIAYRYGKFKELERLVLGDTYGDDMKIYMRDDGTPFESMRELRWEFKIGTVGQMKAAVALQRHWMKIRHENA